MLGSSFWDCYKPISGLLSELFQKMHQTFQIMVRFSFICKLEKITCINIYIEVMEISMKNIGNKVNPYV